MSLETAENPALAPRAGRLPSGIETAAEAAAAVAHELGLDTRDADVIAGSNNTIILLPRAQAVAKVGTSDLRSPTGHGLARELDVGRHLAARAAPIVPPLPGELAGPHERDGFVVTLWSYCPTVSEPTSRDTLVVAQALADVHVALADYRGELPELADHLARAAALVADAEATPALAEEDRRILLGAYDERVPLLGEPAIVHRPLHGEPHSGNVLWTEDGPRLIDFEAACEGPIEWDLAYLPSEAGRMFPDASPKVVEHCRLLVSFAVAAWCWTKPNRSPAVAKAARLHLDRVRHALAA